MCENERFAYGSGTLGSAASLVDLLRSSIVSTARS
jgi:hypothetical protein